MLTVQVNLHTITKNIALIKKHLHSGTKICAVIKDNAYGLGLLRIGELLTPLVDCFAVATVTEGIILRQAGINKDILLLGICEDVTTAIQYNLTITVESIKQAQALHQSGLHPRIHLAVNTGMNRFGISSIHELRKTLQLLSHDHIEGVYTHLAYESDHPDAIKKALKLFQKFVTVCQKYFPKVLIHAGCSGVISYPAAHFSMIRIGKALYGGSPETQNTLTVTSKIIAVKKIKPGCSVGYGGTFTAVKPTVIGIVEGGYANGIPTNFTNRVKVIVGNQHCPIVGRICMDYFFIDVSNINSPQGQAVTIISSEPEQSLLAIAKQAQIPTCQLLLGLGTRLTNQAN